MSDFDLGRRAEMAPPRMSTAGIGWFAADGWRLSVALLAFWPVSAVAAGLDEVGGIQVPLLTAAFAVLGVLLARPIAPRGNPPLSFTKNILVTLILCLLVLAWVIDSRPGLLFSFIMSIGVGFSGLAIIELAGSEALAVVRRIFSGINPKGGSDA